MATRPPRRRMGVMPGRTTYAGFTPGGTTAGAGGGGDRPPGFGYGSDPTIPGQGQNPWDYTAMSGCDVVIDNLPPQIPQQMKEIGRFYCYQYGTRALQGWLARAGVGTGNGNGNGTAPEDLVDPEACQEGYRKVGDKCVRIQAALPGGDPLFTDVGWTPVTGSFGIAGYTPLPVQSVRLSCPRGYVLGNDNTCYPKAVLPRRSQWRKWKGARRPPVSVRDAQAIRRAERARKRVKKLASDVGFKTSKR